MTISVLLIDDEAPARRELHYLFEQLDDVTIAGEAASSVDALRLLRQLKPDLLLLDIQMPGLTGIELARIIQELPEQPLIVFSTAYSQFAVDAFSVEAFDYLLKPVTLERLAKTMEKVRKHLTLCKKPAEPLLPDQPHEERKWIAARQGTKILPIAPESIIFVRCNETVTHIHTSDRAYHTGHTLTALQEQLEPYAFFRAHRNALVNLNCVLEIIPWFSGSCKLVMNDPARTEILVSRYHARDLKKHLIAQS
ncbi:LytTR family DNA-binding domain-containing protein [Geobacter pelophilus]|jgi:DNA-binding LytR/AlgR family response regulator|uniref:LytTR family DNA-binding domain-containing protein n=1 Tax=Geoanaerobacter pelophilus TaxID=60036 RepID=A0AAW4L007_9BACT|nr:LytTR family DNA-binding domain-containing protein [Geoanaerobacter pelophilus]MBT0664168.1 LytTR family DNA-binding domain-containing protein [Geoanaerobacter pelophilus]